VFEKDIGVRSEGTESLNGRASILLLHLEERTESNSRVTRFRLPEGVDTVEKVDFFKSTKFSRRAGALVRELYGGHMSSQIF
jgi:hypothetical protein